MAFDFEKQFESFVMDSGTSAIKDVYNIIPALNQEQMQMIHTLIYYSKKYDLIDLQGFIDNYLLSLKQNKNLSILTSMNVKALLKAYTQDELIRGIKVSSQRMEGGDS